MLNIKLLPTFCIFFQVFQSSCDLSMIVYGSLFLNRVPYLSQKKYSYCLRAAKQNDFTFI